MRWQQCLAHTDSIQNPAKSPECLLGVVLQPTDSRLSETTWHRSLQWAIIDVYNVRRYSIIDLINWRQHVHLSCYAYGIMCVLQIMYDIVI